MEYYNREEFIKNYELTKEEYLVLPFKERMEYANQIFGYKVANLKQIGDSIVFGHVIDDRFYEYFEYCGCQVCQKDLGAEVTEIVKVAESEYVDQAEVRETIAHHIKLIGSIKAEIIAEKEQIYYKVQKGRKNHHFTEKFNYSQEVQRIKYSKVENLPAYEQRWLIPVELENLIKSLDDGNQEYLDLLVSEEYLNYLKRQGYAVEQENNTKRYLLYK